MHRALGLEQLKLFAARRPYRCQALRANLPLSVRHLIGARHDERGLCVGQLGAVNGGEGVPGGGATVAGTCAHLDSLAKAEGGDKLDDHEKQLGKNCTQNLGEEKARMGDEAWGKFSLCIASKTKLSEALSDCKP